MHYSWEEKNKTNHTKNNPQNKTTPPKPTNQKPRKLEKELVPLHVRSHAKFWSPTLKKNESRADRTVTRTKGMQS